MCKESIEKLTLTSTKEGLDRFVNNVSCENCPLSELCIWSRRVWNQSICKIMEDKSREIEDKI